MQWRVPHTVLTLSLVLLAVPPVNSQSPPNPTPSLNGNTAGGANALISNTTGINNTAFGHRTLYTNRTGHYNTAIGREALVLNTDGDFNTASGFQALRSNTTGFSNTASGYLALYANTTGHRNLASGNNALRFNTTGYANSASGIQALYANTTGTLNTALGYQTLLALTAGHRNMALGWGAGNLLASGSDNIYVGHPGVASESATLRLGSTQTRAFIKGVFGTALSGNTVLVNSAGQLGVLVSSARYKQDIEALSTTQSEKVRELRPVTFRYKTEPEGPRQYGLIAEEVARVYPELVTRDADGEIEGVRYEALTPLLVKELQGHHQQIATQAQQLAAQTQQLAVQEQQIQAVLQQVAELKRQNDSLRAMVTQLQDAQVVVLTSATGGR